MNGRFLFAILVVMTTVSGMIYSAVQTSAKAVVTVDALTREGRPRANIRLGARVADLPIVATAVDQPEVRFTVRDITGSSALLPVHYSGLIPDTLKSGRDVILEGTFSGDQFMAKSLMTQCPSKYEPPTAPGDARMPEPQG